VDQVQVDVVGAQSLQAGVEGAERRVVAVAVVVQFRREEDLGPVQDSFRYMAAVSTLR